jgi:hypothetical protein
MPEPKDAPFGQGVIALAEKAYRALGAISSTERPSWETLDQGQKDTLALMWFAGFLTGRTQPASLS